MTESIRDDDQAPRSHPAVQRFVEEVGLLWERDGLPRISGKIVALLIIEDREFDLEELADRLQVSRASVSTNTRLLESHGVLRRTSRPGDRRTYYQATREYGRRFELALERLGHLVDLIERTREELPPDMERGRERLVEMQSFYEFVLPRARAVLEDWVRLNAGTTGRPGSLG
jgi:DNA-binding transcriptional regulator GbsR (MarR family)